MHDRVDATDARLLRALAESPRATVLALAESTGLSRNTVQARLSRLEARAVLGSFERRIDPAALGTRWSRSSRCRWCSGGPTRSRTRSRPSPR